MADWGAALNSCPSALPTAPRPKLATSCQPRVLQPLSSLPSGPCFCSLSPPPRRKMALGSQQCSPTDVHGFLPLCSPSFFKAGTELGDGTHLTTNLQQLCEGPPGHFSAFSSLQWGLIHTILTGLERKWKRLLWFALCSPPTSLVLGP